MSQFKYGFGLTTALIAGLLSMYPAMAKMPRPRPRRPIRICS